MNVSSLTSTGQSPLVAFSISSNVLLVPQFQFFDCLLDYLIPTIISHRLGTEIYKLKHSMIDNHDTLFLAQSIISKNIAVKYKFLIIKELPVVTVSTSSIPLTLN